MQSPILGDLGGTESKDDVSYVTRDKKPYPGPYWLKYRLKKLITCLPNRAK